MSRETVSLLDGQRTKTFRLYTPLKLGNREYLHVPSYEVSTRCMRLSIVRLDLSTVRLCIAFNL